MQTKLMAVGLMLAASLLWAPRMSAAPKSVKKSGVLKYSTTHNIPIIWCDLHLCKEKMRYVGTASYYGKGYWQGRKMANGQPFDYRKITVALWYLPLGTQVRITNLENGKSVVATVTDRGPAHALHRIADLSQAAAEALDYTQKGLTKVLVQTVPVLTLESATLSAQLVEPGDSDTQEASIIGDDNYTD